MAKEIRKTVRFSDEEYSRIEPKLKEHNLTFAEFARASILNKKIKTKLTREMIFQTQKIGSNLNQIAKQLNQKKDIPNSQILKVLISIQAEIEKLKS